MKKIMKIGPILLVAFVAVAFAFPAQALITNADIANNAGISHSKLKLGGKIDSDDIKDGSIRSKDIKNGTVSSNDIKNGTIQSEDIEDGTITADDLVASFIASSQIVDDSIVNADINSAAGIVYSKLAFSNNIVAGDIATGAVTTTEILDGTIATGDISTGGVTSGNILNGTIAGGDLATNIAITTSGTANFTGDVTLGSDGFDVIVDSDAWFVDVNGNSWFYGITNSSGVIYANGGIANTEAEALAINANGAQKIILGGTSTGDIDLTRNVNALAGLDVTGALTVSTTSTLTGNVDAQDGLDVTGGAMTFNGTAGSWTVAEADSALTQTGTGQVTFTGNVDATNGLDVTVADLTVGGANFGVTVGNGNVATAGTVTAAGVVNANGGIANTEAEALAINANGAQKIILGGTSTGDIDLTRNVNALAGLDVTGALTVSTTADVTGLANLNGGIAVDTSNFTVDGTNGDVLTAGDLDVNGNDIDSSGSMDITGATGMNINTGAGDITLDPAGNDVLPGGDSADNLGADATRWSAIYADTLNYATALTDGGATNVTTVTLGTSAADAVTINANTAITDDNWSVSNAGAAAFASATVNGVNVVTAGTGTGNVNSTMILDGTITADDLAANSVDSSEIVTDAVGSSEIAESAVGSSEIANSSVSNVDLADDAVTSSKIYDGTITGSDLASNIAITTSGTFSSSGTVNFSGATSVRIPSGTATPGTCSVGELFVDTNGNSETITSGNADNTATVYMYVCTSSNVWTPVVKD